VKAHLCVLIDPFGHLTIDGRVAVPAKNTPYAAERRSSRRRFINTASGVPVFQCSRKLRSILPPDFHHPSLISASVIEPTPNAAGCAHPSPPFPPTSVSPSLHTTSTQCFGRPSFSWSTWECACDGHKGTTDRRSEADQTSFYFSSFFYLFLCPFWSCLALPCVLARSLFYSVIRSSRRGHSDAARRRRRFHC
jgi:hypothetical protein